MSDTRLYAETGGLERPHMTCSCGNYCYGGVRREITVDYASATDEADRLLGKLTAHYADVVAIVDAALADYLTEEETK